MEKLSSSILSASSLPLKPTPVILQGKFITLRPLNIDKDAEILYKISNGSSFRIGEKFQPEYDSNELIWKLMHTGPFSSLSEFKDCLNYLQSFPDRLIFCVVDLLSNHLIGSASLTNNEPEHLKIEIGWGWFTPMFQRTGASTESVLLMLTHVFNLGYQRVQATCISINSRSHEFILKSGFVYELTMQCYAIGYGYSVDVEFFRILNKEWEQVKKKLEKRIYSYRIAYKL